VFSAEGEQHRAALAKRVDMDNVHVIIVEANRQSTFVEITSRKW
jgi:hypothetical protein